MPSTIMHLCVAKLVNKKIKSLSKESFYLGAIAPDYIQVLGLDKKITHYCNYESEDKNQYVDFEKIEKLYKEKFSLNDFDIGVYVHLITDDIWIKYLEKNKYLENDDLEKREKLYEEYDKLNLRLIRDYDIKYNELNDWYKEKKSEVISNIEEIDIEKIEYVFEKLKKVLEKTYSENEEMFKYSNVTTFINKTAKEIIKKISKLNTPNII